MGCVPESTHVKPRFLEGKWKRVNDKPNQSTFEFWNNNLTGIGFTLQKKDTTFKEVLSIVPIQDTLFLKVVGVNENPTLFKFTSQTDHSFVCENPKNEFPKKIEYKLKNDTLKARVSNPDFGIDFIFVKM